MNKDNKFSYNLISPKEITQVYNLIKRVFHDFVAPTYSKEGISTFYDMLSKDFFKVFNNEQFTIVAKEDNRIIGMISITSKLHIALLFVDTDYQGRGVGKLLIKKSIDMCVSNNKNIKKITVSSSPNSISFYKKNGFRVIGMEKKEKGMRFTPMEFVFD